MSEQNNTFLGMQMLSQEELGEIGLGAGIGLLVSAGLYAPVHFNVYSTKVLLTLLAVLTVLVLLNTYNVLGMMEPMMSVYTGTTAVFVYILVFLFVLAMGEKKYEDEDEDEY